MIVNWSNSQLNIIRNEDNKLNFILSAFLKKIFMQKLTIYLVTLKKFVFSGLKILKIHRIWNIISTLCTIRKFFTKNLKTPKNVGHPVISLLGKKGGGGENIYFRKIYTPDDLPRTFLGRILKDSGLLTTFFRALQRDQLYNFRI